jgi:hypothetical protein
MTAYEPQDRDRYESQWRSDREFWPSDWYEAAVFLEHARCHVKNQGHSMALHDAVWELAHAHGRVNDGHQADGEASHV